MFQILIKILAMILSIKVRFSTLNIITYQFIYNCFWDMTEQCKELSQKPEECKQEAHGPYRSHEKHF